ncbi:MAG: ATP synthase F0 subunit B [Clostridiales bacterium]|jgi:F-type H+-transporting ATPase subunit b|nr:ATP synthase F0 subunit B [Clostridiales bacterium]
MDRIIGFDSQLIIQALCQILSVTLCIFILSKFLYFPVKKFLEDRENNIKKNIDKAQENLSQAEIFVELYEQKINDIADKEREILKLANENAVIIKKDIIHEANLKAKEILNDANESIKLELEKAKDDIKSEIINVSWAINSELIKNDNDSKKVFLKNAFNVLEKLNNKNKKINK